MKKKSTKTILLFSFLLGVIFLLGCTPKRDEYGNVPITSNWELVKFTVNGQTTDVQNESPLVKAVTASAYPKFKCKDGVNCTFTMSGKTHKGVINGQAGRYAIVFNDTSKSMMAEVYGDTLRLRNPEGTVLLEFVAN